MVSLWVELKLTADMKEQMNKKIECNMVFVKTKDELYLDLTLSKHSIASVYTSSQ